MAKAELKTKLENLDCKKGWEALKNAEREFKAWALNQKMPLARVEYVATFEKWDKKTEIYVFFFTDSGLQLLKREGKLSEIERIYRRQLLNASYPFDRWPITFYFDSHENVEKNYAGNYFYRLR